MDVRRYSGVLLFLKTYLFGVNTNLLDIDSLVTKS
jgi:hypothetical protein